MNALIHSFLKRCILIVLPILLATVSLLAGQVAISRAPEQVHYILDDDAATDFSGITWVGGDDFYTVSNRTKAFFRVNIQIGKTSGKILRAEIKTQMDVKVDGLSDFEGVFYNSKQKRVYISAEQGDGILEIGPDGGRATPVAVPKIFKSARNNKSLESLTGSAALGQYWTGNEDTLKCDGEVSKAEGALVRFQMFNSKWKPLEQYAYRTDPSTFRYKGGGTGVCDLLLLPTGELLVLERVVFGLGLQVKIFQVDFKDATDTTKIKNLHEAKINPLGKTLLFEQYTGTLNYEGLTLGPALVDGWTSLILIADSGGTFKHALMPLKIKVTGK